MNNLPPLFITAGIMQIQVDTSLQTTSDGLNGVIGLAAGTSVSVRGLLFGPVSGPTPIGARVGNQTATSGAPRGMFERTAAAMYPCKKQMCPSAMRWGHL
jgi:hypothetical protein